MTISTLSPHSTVAALKQKHVPFEPTVEVKMSKLTLDMSDGTASAVTSMNDAMDPRCRE